jgi:YD repeat-containing protein
VFDDLNRQEQIIGALGQTTTFSYDAVGNRITAIDALSLVKGMVKGTLPFNYGKPPHPCHSGRNYLQVEKVSHRPCHCRASLF